MFTVMNIDCATYDMPRDRTGAVPGTTKVRAMRVAAAEGPRAGTMFAIAGGPGQGSQEMISFISALFEGANRYDVVAVDQRGSGASEPLDCPRIETGDFNFSGDDPATDRPITSCSVSLGAARSTYNTAEAIADIEAIRQDLGIDKITLFGVSYGTKVALAYARTYPDHVQSLLLDSVLPVEEPTSFDLASIEASRRALGDVCGSGRCKTVNKSPVSSLAKVSTELERNPIDTYIVSDLGKVSKGKIDAEALYSIVFEADFNLFIYNQLPAAMTTALHGDTAMLERLYAIVSGAYGSSDSLRGARRIAKRAPKHKSAVTRKPGTLINGRDAESLASFSNTMNLATSCADFNPPWVRGPDLTGRQAAIDAAANAVRDSQFYPFARKTARNQSIATICRGWQQSAVAPTISTAPLPDVPTLALDGALDLRTPISWAKRAIASNPKAQFKEIPFTGHSVIGTDISGCAARSPSAS